MGVVTRYRVACQIRVLRGSPLRKERKKAGVRALPGTRLYMSQKGHDIVVHPRYWKIMKVVDRCLKHGGEVDYETQQPTPAELAQGWESVVNIALHWSEKGLSYGKRAIHRRKVHGAQFDQSFAGELNHQGLPGAGVRDDSAPDLLSDGRPCTS